jgi:hypothetical protein
MLIGQSKVSDFEPISDEELAQFRATLDDLMRDGAPPNLPIGVDIGVLAQLLVTIAALKAPVIERPKLMIPGLIADAHLADDGE